MKIDTSYRTAKDKMFKSNPFTNSAATASFSPRNGSVQPLVYPRPSFQAALTAEQHRALQEHHKIQIQQTIANKDKSTEVWATIPSTNILLGNLRIQFTPPDIRGTDSSPNPYWSNWC